MKFNSITLSFVATLALSSLIFAQDDNQAKYDKKIKAGWIKAGGWELDHGKAMDAAKSEGKYILAYFSRSYAP